MPSQSPHADTTAIVGNVQKEQTHRASWNSQLSPAERRVSALAGKRDSYQGGSSTASTMHAQNSTHASLLNNPRSTEITQHMNVTQSAPQRKSINTRTATLGSNTPAPVGTSQTASMHCNVSSPTSSIASTHAPLSGLEYMPTPIPNSEAHAIIPNPLQMRAIERNPRQELAIATTGGVYTSLTRLRLSQHPSIWSLRHDASCICNGQTHGALYVEHRYAAKWHSVHCISGTHKSDLERGMLK